VPCDSVSFPIPGATDFAACEDACIAAGDQGCGDVRTYFDLTRPPGCYLVSRCSQPADRAELAQRSYERVCDLLEAEQLRPPPRLALGRGHSCLLLTNGNAQCWGANAHVEQLDEWTEVEVSTLELAGGPFTRLAAAAWSTCGIRPDHGVTCSSGFQPSLSVDVADLDGSNNRGFLALRTDGRVYPGGTSRGWVRAACGAGDSCLLAGDGRVECDGLFIKTNQLYPLVAPSGRFVRLAVGDGFACGVRATGTLACWGSDEFGQTSPPAGQFSDVTAGYTHACALRPDGTIACWGDNAHGQATPPAGQFAEVVASYDHTCAIPSGSTDQVICWGSDDRFQSSPPWALRVDPTPSVQWVVGGSAVFDYDQSPYGYWEASALPVHGCGLAQDGSIQCFGSAGEPPSGAGFTELSAGVGSTCALSASGVECWGEQYYARWSGTVESPVNGVSLEGDFTRVSTGWDLACALRADAALVCWGPEASGPLAPSGEFTSVAAGGSRRRGSRHACGVRDDASITCWSYDDDTDEMGIPYDVAGSFKAVAVGYTIDCALDVSGHLRCWDSALGPASDPGAALPAPEGEFTRVVAGDGQACALRANGAVTCWTAMEDHRYVVLDGEYPGPFVDLTMGGDYACGLLANGAFRCWGAYIE
jgi:alpha-tubulin suppressor-like RCC1 family protein